ncbi:ribonuclease P protein component 1 [archaeon]|nr:ribonuclease P protein component 1 [archaeon]
MIKITVHPHELIGSQLEILDSTSKNLVGLEGKIIDESRSLLYVKIQEGKEVKILKTAIIRLKVQNQNYENELMGKAIFGRPWDRIKG